MSIYGESMSLITEGKISNKIKNKIKKIKSNLSGLKNKNKGENTEEPNRAFVKKYFYNIDKFLYIDISILNTYKNNIDNLDYDELDWDCEELVEDFSTKLKEKTGSSNLYTFSNGKYIDTLFQSFIKSKNKLNCSDDDINIIRSKIEKAIKLNTSNIEIYSDFIEKFENSSAFNDDVDEFDDSLYIICDILEGINISLNKILNMINK